MNTKSANEVYSHFTGTEAYHRFSMITRLLCTDGAIKVAEDCGAFWLLDIITDFPYASVELWVENGIILLPSER